MQSTGGGYAIPPVEGHVRFWQQTVSELEKQDKGLAVAVLEYSEAYDPPYNVMSCRLIVIRPYLSGWLGTKVSNAATPGC